jgi:hypothetical protein
MRRALLLVVLASCTDNTGGGGGGGDITTHVIQLVFDGGANSSCIDSSLFDADPNVPGPQFDCSVSEFQNYGQPNQVETLLVQCNNLATPDASTNKPCWAILNDPPTCPNVDHQVMSVQRTGAPPPNTKVMAQCVAKGA